jgi:hypothetical protein
MKSMKPEFAAVLIVVLVVICTLLPAYGEVETISVSPPAPVVGQPITFSGTVSGSTLNDQIAIYVYPGSNCPASNPVASTYTLASNATYAVANNTIGVYNATLAFPVSSSSGWKVETQYRDELPAGSYSVGVQDVASNAVLCKNFAVENSTPVPEFSGLTVTILLTLLAPLYIVRRKGNRKCVGYAPSGKS